MKQGLDNLGQTEYNTNDRVFWLAIRQALLIAVRAIEDRFDLPRSHLTKSEQGRRE